MTPYVEADVGRAGLGNCLLTWARAVIFSEAHQFPMLYPDWGRFRLGPYLRGEKDKREYGKLFTPAEYVHGWKKFLIEQNSPEIDETEWRNGMESEPVRRRVTFRGLGDYFTPLLGHHDLLRRRLWGMIRQEWRQEIERRPVPSPYIAVHIRRGDQVLPKDPESKVQDHIQCTRLDWFDRTLEKIRNHEQFLKWPIYIFTDGSDSQVQALLNGGNVFLAPPSCSIVDLWRLSQAGLLVASGYSTFSMWASFLGRMPTLYAPGKIQQRLHPESDGIEFELDDDAPLPGVLLSRFSSR